MAVYSARQPGERLEGGVARPPSLEWAVRALREAPHRQSVTALREQSGLSHRRFIERFRDEVGMTPKLFGRISRLQAVLRGVEAQQRIDWAGIAAAYGYFDQAHLIRDLTILPGSVRVSTSSDALDISITSSNWGERHRAGRG